MPKNFRASEEVAALIAQVQGQVDAIKAKWDTTDPTPEEVATMNELVTQLEALAAEAQVAAVEERSQKVKAQLEAPKTPAPKFTVPATPKKALSAGEVFHAALKHGFREPLDSELHYRMGRAGVNLGSINIPTDFSLLNAHKRKQFRTLSKGANPGNDLIFNEYSNNIVEIMAYESPLLSVLNVESEANGNLKSYFTLDDSANASTDITASSGTELNPTIPDKDVSDSVKKCGVFTITSGYQKITRESLQDSFPSLEANFARWSGKRHAQKLEADIIGATGNGETGREGLLQAATSATAISGGAWTYSGLQTFYYGIPIQYRKDLVFVVSEQTYGDLHADLLDGNERSYFDVSVQNDHEYETLLGKKIFVSTHMDDDKILAFDPNYFVVRTVNSSSFDMLTEKFYPHLAGVSMMRFGCMWNGPAAACKKVSLTS